VLQKPTSRQPQDLLKCALFFKKVSGPRHNLEFCFFRLFGGQVRIGKAARRAGLLSERKAFRRSERLMMPTIFLRRTTGIRLIL
jgi:hypothetical protein